MWSPPPAPSWIGDKPSSRARRRGLNPNRAYLSEFKVKVAERWFVMAGIGLLGAIALAGLVVAVYAAWLFHDLPDASDLADYRPPTATRVYAGDGTLIGEFSDERRIYEIGRASCRERVSPYV